MRHTGIYITLNKATDAKLCDLVKGKCAPAADDASDSKVDVIDALSFMLVCFKTRIEISCLPRH